MCFPQSPDRWLIGGSNFGLEKHPAWSWNLIANPNAEIHFERELIPVRARLLTQAEADVVWPSLEEQWPHYRDYEKTAHRSIRIFELNRSE